MNLRIVAPAVALPLVLAACAPRAVPADPPVSDEQRVCTMEYRTYTVRVETAQGTPVSDARIDVRRADGSSLVCTADGQTGCLDVRRVGGAEPSNTYTIMTDGVELVRGGENVTVNASAGGKTVAGVFRFAHDGCHVRKVSGPDVLTLAP